MDCFRQKNDHVVVFLDLCKNGLLQPARDLYYYNIFPKSSTLKENKTGPPTPEERELKGNDDEKVERLERPALEKERMLRARDQLEKRTCLHIVSS
jgi:hypothetical protein